MTAMALDREQACEWTEDEDGRWDTACGRAFEFIDSGPAENGAHFCQYCGGRLAAKAFKLDPTPTEDK